MAAAFTDGNGNFKSFGLNRFGSRTSTTDGVGAVTARVRDANNKTTRIDMPEGRVTEMTYDSRGNRLSRRKAAGDALEQLTTFEYELVFNKVTKVIDPALNETVFAYDGNGNLLSRTDALLNPASFTYDARGLVLTRTDRNGEVTSFAYDANGNLDTITDAELNVTDFTRDAAGNVTQNIQGLGTPEARITTMTFDARNRILTATDGAGGITTFRYDAAGNVEEFENATGQIEFRAYDPLNRVTEVNNPASGITTTAYDGNGNATSVTDALSNVTTFEYDGANRMTKQIDALLGERLFAYDLEDNVISVTDARGQVTTFAYDTLDRVEQRTNPVNDVVSFTYDSRNNLITRTDPKAQVATNTYDALNRLTQVLTPDNLIALGYDPVGNVTSVADDDSDLSFGYDGLNRAVTAATGLGGVQPLVALTNSYDAVGNRTQLADDAGLSGALTGFAHDGAGRLTQLTTPAGQPIGLGYDALGRTTGMTFPNTVTSTMSYDPLTGRLAQITHSAGATPLADFGYGYNGVGSIDSIAELGQTRNFTYDDLQRLIAGGTAAAPESYAYDEEGNRTVSHLSAAHTTDTANRLTEDDPFTYLYDANGNLTSKTAKAGGAVTSYTWDAQDQLTRIDFPDLSFADYRYDGLGRRIEKDANGTVTRYVYDGAAILLEFDGLENLLARYSHGQGIDQPLAVERGGQSYYYQADHQGSLRKITDAAGLVVNAYDYDSYGRIEASFEGISNPFTYTGREFDAESGLYYYRARYYDPATGRFLAEDPIGFGGGDANLYRYVFNNPVNLQDPTGQLVPPVVYAAVEATINLLGALYIALSNADPDPVPKPQPDPEAGGDNDDPKPVPVPSPDPKRNCEDPGDNEGDPDGGDGNGDNSGDDDDYCIKEQERLLNNRQIILLLLVPGDNLSVRQYRNATLRFNVDAKFHNSVCLRHRVPMLPLGPQSEPYQ